MKALVTGAAGFIGSHLVDRLLAEGYDVVGFDNFSTGCVANLDDALKHQFSRFTMIEANLLDKATVVNAMANVDVVFHLAANADVRHGPEHPEKDFIQNTQATWNVLEAMRQSGVDKIVFTSTASVYGVNQTVPTPEDALLAPQTSLYGASKLAAEGFIQAYCESFGMQAWVFRLVSILGERYSHGHVVDFYRQLSAHPDRITVLGDGSQRKSYLYVEDCVDAMLVGFDNAREKVNTFNVGSNEYWYVNWSVRYIYDHMGVSPDVSYTGGLRGWTGDIPVILLDCSRLRELGWAPKVKVGLAYQHTLDYLQNADQAKPIQPIAQELVGKGGN